MNSLIEMIDVFKTKISDNEYLDLMNELQKVYNDRVKPPNWSDLMTNMEEEQVIDHLPPSIQYRLEYTKDEDLALEMTRVIQEQARLIQRLNSVILHQAIQINETKCSGINLTHMFSE